MSWNACTMEPSIVLRWVECHPAMAAWVQAIGTIFAVFIAVAVPIAAEFLLKRGRVRQSNRDTATAFLRVRQSLIGLQNESDLRIQWLERVPLDMDGQIGRMWLEGMQIPIDPALTRAPAEFSGLRADFSKAVLLGLENASQFNAWVNKVSSYPEQFFPERWPAIRQAMLDIARKSRDEAAKAIEVGYRI